MLNIEDEICVNKNNNSSPEKSNKNISNFPMISDEIPLWERYLLKIDEASYLYHIGQVKLRKMADEYPDADFFLFVGSKILIKRKQFEQFIDGANSI